MAWRIPRLARILERSDGSPSSRSHCTLSRSDAVETIVSLAVRRPTSAPSLFSWHCRQAADGSTSSGSRWCVLMLFDPEAQIAEVKEKEQRTLEEILYALVVQQFAKVGVSLVPALSLSIDCSGRVDHWAETVEEKLQRLHSLEAYEMIENHLTLILGQRQADATIAAITKLRVGQVYAACVMYGYFLKKVDQRRFQLEKTMKRLLWGSEKEDSALNQAMTTDSMPSAQASSSHPEMGSSTAPAFNTGGPSKSIKSSRLRLHVMSFDSDTLQSYATVRSKEAFGIIEKHTEALSGKPEIITPEDIVDSSKDEHIRISFAGLRRLFLEAVTFGLFLWEVQSFVGFN